MSTHEEIMEVYEQDIAQMNKQVLNKSSIMAFLDDSGMSVHNLFEGITSADDRRLLAKILEQDELAEGGVT